MREMNNEAGDRLVWFTGHPRPFLIDESYCINLDCPCNAATLRFEEVCEDGARLAEGIHFTLNLDLQTWAELAPPKRSPQVRSFVEEFLGDLSDERKQAFRDNRWECRDTQRKLTTFTMPAQDVREGVLLSYSEVMVDDRDNPAEMMQHWFAFQYEGELWLVEDLYCSNPRCQCREAHVVFYPCRPRQGQHVVSKDRFSADLPFDGEAEIHSLNGCTRSRAQALLAEWTRANPDARDVLQQRYDEVKEIGRRSLRAETEAHRAGKRPRRRNKRSSKLAGRSGRGAPGRRLPAGTFVRQGPKVRPNDPCPCGSGKKYKKCCGR